MCAFFLCHSSKLNGEEGGEEGCGGEGTWGGGRGGGDMTSHLLLKYTIKVRHKLICDIASTSLENSCMWSSFISVLSFLFSGKHQNINEILTRR